MPDKRHHRGRHPEDERLFAEPRVPILRTAAAELSWLLTRGYAPDSATKLVGDRHDLTTRQRVAVRRSACPDDALRDRCQRELSADQVHGRPLSIDGYNLLITLESALSGGLVLVGRDGACRDLASIHGTYRRVEETRPALDVIAGEVAGLGAEGVNWYLDRPVSNSGRLKTLFAELLEERQGGEGDPSWNIEIVDSPDRSLIAGSTVVATSDSVVLDRCGPWFNLAGYIIRRRVPDAWIIDLRSSA